MLLALESLCWRVVSILCPTLSSLPTHMISSIPHSKLQSNQTRETPFDHRPRKYFHNEKSQIAVKPSNHSRLVCILQTIWGINQSSLSPLLCGPGDLIWFNQFWVHNELFQATLPPCFVLLYIVPHSFFSHVMYMARENYKGFLGS